MALLDSVRGSACTANPAKLISNLTSTTDGVVAMAFSPDRSLLASVGREGMVCLWEVNHKSPRERGRFRQHGNPFQSVAFSPNGRLVAVGSAMLNGFIWLYDVSDKSPQEVGVLRGAKGAVNGLAFSPDSKLVAGAGEDRTLRIWEHGPGSRGDARAILPGHTGPIRAVAFAPDGYSAASGGRDGTVRLWTISRIRSSEKAVVTVGGEIDSLAYSPDGKTLVTAGRGTNVKLWDLSSFKPTVRTDLGSSSANVQSVIFTPDAQLVVGIGEDGRVMNWDPRTGKPMQVWDVPGGPGSASAVTLDGRYLARGTSSGTAELYRVAEKRA